MDEASPYCVAKARLAEKRKNVQEQLDAVRPLLLEDTYREIDKTFEDSCTRVRSVFNELRDSLDKKESDFLECLTTKKKHQYDRRGSISGTIQRAEKILSTADSTSRQSREEFFANYGSTAQLLEENFMELLLLPESIQKDHSHTDEAVLSDMEKDVSLLVEAVGLHCNTAAGLCLSGDPAHTGGCVHEPSSSGTPVEGESTRTNAVSQDTLNTSAITSLCHSEGEMLNQQSSVCCESEERVSSYNDSGAGQNEVTTEDKPGVSTESGQVAVQSHSTVDLEVRSETEFHGLIASTHTMEQCLPNCAHKKKAVSVLQCVSGDLSEESVAQQKAEAHPFEAAVEVCNDLHPEEVVGALDLAVMDEGLSGEPAHTGGCVQEPSSGDTPVVGESTRTNEVSQDTSAFTLLMMKDGEMMNQQSSVCSESKEHISSYNDSSAGQNEGEVTTEDKPGVSTESSQVDVQSDSHKGIKYESHSNVLKVDSSSVQSENELHISETRLHAIETCCVPTSAQKEKAVNPLQSVSGDLSEEIAAQQNTEAHPVPFEDALEHCSKVYPDRQKLICVLDLAMVNDAPKFEPVHTEPSSSDTPVVGESTRTNEVCQDTLNSDAIISLCHSEGGMINPQNSVHYESKEHVSSYSDSSAGQIKPGVSTESIQVDVHSDSHRGIEYESRSSVPRVDTKSVRSDNEPESSATMTLAKELLLHTCQGAPSAQKEKAVSVLKSVSEDLSEDIATQQKAKAHPVPSTSEPCRETGPNNLICALDLAVVNDAIPSLKFLPGSQHKVVVVDVISPSCFYAQPYGPDLVKLMKDLRAFYGAEEQSVVSSYVPAVGTFCCAKYTGDDHWYRAKVLRLEQNENVTMVKVYYVDYGNQEVLPSSRIRPLPSSFCTLPCQSLQCCLENVLPMAETSATGSLEWSFEICTWFSQLLLGNHAEIVVSSCDSDGMAVVDILLATEKLKATSFPSVVGFCSATVEHNSVSVCLSPFMVSVGLAKCFTESRCKPLSKTGIASMPSVLDPPHSAININSLPPLLTHLGGRSEIAVLTTSITSPSQIYVYPITGDVANRMTMIPKLLASHYSECASNVKLCPKDADPGSLCVLYLQDDKLWYRGVITGHPSGSQCVQVRLLDYGDYVEVGVDELLVLHEMFLQFPPQCVCCNLLGVCEDKRSLFDSGAMHYLEHLIGNKQLVACVDGFEARSCIRVHCDSILNVELFDTNGETDLCVNQLLIKSLRVCNDPDSDEKQSTKLRSWNPLETDFLADRNNYSIDDEDVGVMLDGYRSGNRICRFYTSKIGCFHGSKCRFLHLREGEYNRHQEECYTSDSTGLALPQPGEWVVLIATTVISDNCIYAQIPLGGGYSLLKGDAVTPYADYCDLQHKMNAYYRKQVFSARTLENLQPGEIVAALYPIDECWYRSRVLKTKGERVKVCYVDYGNISWIKLSSLRCMLPEFLTVPFQVVVCHIVSEDHTRFHTKCVQQQFENKLLIARMLWKGHTNEIGIEIFHFGGISSFDITPMQKMVVIPG